LTVNGVEREIASNTADTLTWATALAGAAATGAFTISPLWAPGPPSSFVGKQQYHHRISTGTAGTEYKAVTSICVNTAAQISNKSTVATGSTIAFTFTLNG